MTRNTKSTYPQYVLFNDKSVITAFSIKPFADKIAYYISYNRKYHV